MCVVDLTTQNPGAIPSLRRGVIYVIHFNVKTNHHITSKLLRASDKKTRRHSEDAIGNELHRISYFK